MSNRLASFRGPSTPTSSPVQQIKQPNSPASPSRSSESTFHRKIRTLLQELRSTAETWDDIVMIDGLKALQSLIDTRTDLDNALALIPADAEPRTRIVGPRVAIMEKRIVELDLVVTKLQRQFHRMDSIIENMESVLFEAHKLKGWQWCQEPMWVSWSLEKFVSSIPQILPAYHRSLSMHIELVNVIRSHSVTFEVSREAIAKWMDQEYLEEGGWEAEWDDICAAEVERWNTR